MEIGETLYASTRAEWRDWLQNNHTGAKEIWLVFYNKASGKPFVAYADAVEEALCFGWIDGIVKRLEQDSRAQRFTPRRPGRTVSELNKERMRSLIDRGLMTDAGLAAVPDNWDTFEADPDIIAALQADPVVRENFQGFPETYQRIRIGWVQETRDAAVREQRLAYLIKMTKAGKKFGSYQ